MNSGRELLVNNILLDQEKFSITSHEFMNLSVEMESLQKDISSLLDELSKGFDTPAGRRFMDSCRRNLIDQLKDQADVIKHVSANLSSARTLYESVFNDYRSLNNLINQDY